MKDWGEIKLVQIDDHDFWCIFDELDDDDSLFLNNRDFIVRSYKDGNLYGLRVDETDNMYKRGAGSDGIFCSDSLYLLPCFCIREEDKAMIIWTHTRARKMGFARKLVELLQIKVAHIPLPDSLKFWKKCNIICDI